MIHNKVCIKTIRNMSNSVSEQSMKNSKTRGTRVLIVEAGPHYKILEQLFYLLEKRCETTFLLMRAKGYDYRDLFPSSKKANVLSVDWLGLFLFPRLLFTAHKYDVINIATGPDHNSIVELVRLPFFFLCCFFHGQKMIFTVRNMHQYLETTPGLFSFIRSRSLRFINRFTFETETMLKVFKEQNKRCDILTGVSYDRYSDYLEQPSHKKFTKELYSKKIRIGLLGSVDEWRRDYKMLFDSLDELPLPARKNFVFVTLGRCFGGAENPVIRRLEEYCEVDTKEGLLTEFEFANRGQGCDVLIAPLNENKAHGTLHGSGSFGDAIFLKKQMILPSFADKGKEFGAFCIYYKNHQNLTSIFKDLHLKPTRKLSKRVFLKYLADHVFRRLVRELNLSQFCM